MLSHGSTPSLSSNLSYWEKCKHREEEQATDGNPRRHEAAACHLESARSWKEEKQRAEKRNPAAAVAGGGCPPAKCEQRRERGDGRERDVGLA